MNKREARKAALRLASRILQDVGENEVDAMPDLDERAVRLVKSEIQRITLHLEWEADGRPERT
jgi:hypothetical protein